MIPLVMNNCSVLPAALRDSPNADHQDVYFLPHDDNAMP